MPVSLTPSSSPSPSQPPPSWKTTFTVIIQDILDNPDHPMKIALRTYLLCLSLSLGPVLLPVVFAPALRPKSFRMRTRVLWRAFLRELRTNRFSPAMTAAVGGGAALRQLWDLLGRRCTRTPVWVCYINAQLTPCQRTFLANAITSTLAVTLLRWRRHRPRGTVFPTLDLSLLFFVRALDASVQAFLLRRAQKTGVRQGQVLSGNGTVSLLPSGVSCTPSIKAAIQLPGKQCDDLNKEWQKKVGMHVDALVFWASSARIMWCFFYQPQRLPSSYAKWINTLANVDKELLEVLRALRESTWSYIHTSSARRNMLCPLAEKLGRSPSWGDPTVLPAYGGNLANDVWRQLGVDGRSGVGGLPCELVHGDIGARFGLQSSCSANAAIRAVDAFAKALVIYFPVHFLPILFTNPNSILRPRHALTALLSAIRSATFLSTFLSSCWFAVCFTRTLVLARLFPRTSHDVWDGPYGGTLAGSLVCGASIWIENARRRGEMALYVLPKALGTLIPEKWLRSGHSVVRLAECLTFVLSLASLLTFSVHQPESLRGLSRWTLAFIMKGSNACFWNKRMRRCPSALAESDPNKD